MFCGLIPGPLQMLGAAICAVVFRVNLPLAMLTTVYTNPFTIVPLYVVAYAIGQWVLPGPTQRFVPPPDWGEESFMAWIASLIDWMAGLGTPLALGLVLLATILAVAGYLLVKLAWRIYLVRAWRRRGRQRAGRQSATAPSAHPQRITYASVRDPPLAVAYSKHPLPTPPFTLAVAPGADD